MASVDHDAYNPTGIIAKSLYFGMFVNVILPAGLGFLCFYLKNNNLFTTGWLNGSYMNLFFIIGCLITILISALVLIQKQKLYSTKLGSSKDQLKWELPSALDKKVRPMFILISLVALWGVLFFFLTAHVEGMLFFVVMSFLIFQFIRPRYGFVKKLIDSQLKLYESE